MANAQKIKNKDGSVSYRIFVNKNGKRESKRFSTKQLATDWANKRLKEIEYAEVYGEKTTAIIKDVIDEYQEKFGNGYGRSKNYDIERLKKYDIAELSVNKLSPKHLIDHCIYRKTIDKVKPQTAGNDVIWLKVVLDTMSAVNGFDYDSKVFEKSYVELKKNGLVAKSKERTRLPSWQELMKLSRHFKKMKSDIPMYEIMWFAYLSTKRMSEVTRIEWSDNNVKDRSGLVRDAKDPKKKEGNHLTFKYEIKAWKIANRQPQTSIYIFPYNAKTIGTYFSNACILLGIKDLHFHDLRHGGTTRLFRIGYQLHEVKLFTLHKDWKSLARYTHLKPKDIK